MTTYNDLKKSILRRHYGARLPIETIDNFIRAAYIDGKQVQDALNEAMVIYTERILGTIEN